MKTAHVGAFVLLLLSASIFSPFPVAAQRQPEAWVTLGPVVGASIGDGAVYQGSPVVGGRVGAGAMISRHFGVEIAGDILRGWGQGDYACVGGTPCPANFDLAGLSGAIVFRVGPANEPTRIRLGVGAGAVRITNDYPYQPALPTVTALHLSGAAELNVLRLGRAGLALAIRPGVVLGANRASLWLVPLSVAVRM